MRQQKVYPWCAVRILLHYMPFIITPLKFPSFDQLQSHQPTDTFSLQAFIFLVRHHDSPCQPSFPCKALSCQSRKQLTIFTQFCEPRKSCSQITFLFLQTYLTSHILHDSKVIDNDSLFSYVSFCISRISHKIKSWSSFCFNSFLLRFILWV